MAEGKKIDYNDPDFQEFVKQMRVIGLTESNNNYNITNPKPGQTATGKYQYNKSHLPEIIKFSKSINMPVSSLEEFKNNSGLQEAYFQYDQYKGYQWAKQKLISNNPFNYNMAELAALRHFQGEGGANKILSTGKHTKKDSLNPSTKEYIEGRFRPALKNAGLYQQSGVEKNMMRAENTNSETKLKIQADYDRDLKNIKDKNLGAVVENSMINQLNQKYFDAGNLEIVNRKIDYRNNSKEKQVDKNFNNIKLLADAFINSGITMEGQTITDMKMAGTLRSDKSSYDQLKALAKQFGEDPKKVIAKDDEAAPWYDARDYYRIDPKTKTGAFLLNPTIDTLKKQQPKISKDQRIVLSQYQKASPNYVPETEEQTTVITDENVDGGVGSGSALVDNQSAAMQNPTVAPATTSTPEKTAFSSGEMMSIFNGGELVPDEEFAYQRGGVNIPWESAGYLLAGLEGVKAGNTDIPLRDEEVSPLMRNYAAELQKIVQMGLPPEVEADLKNKQAAAYQVGLQNIVRASGGNRNLVLGNQGQLDLARMNGITDIALMDVERRDKALSQYGEVVQYMDSFYANRDVANNERMYHEAEKKQMAGAQLAQQGFSALIDSIKYAKENGPGSANDMMRQYLMYSISGVNPGIDDDGSGTIPGTESYATAQRNIQSAQKDERQKVKSFYSTQTKEDKEKFNQFMYENEHLRPDVNKEITFDQIKTEFDNYTGATQGRQEAANEQGVISLTEDEVNNPEKYDKSEPMPILNAYGRNPQASIQQQPSPLTTASTPPVQATPITGTAMGSPLLTMPAAVDNTQKVTDRYRTANAALEEYLANQSSKVNQSLDKTIDDTEKATENMKLQINNTY